MQHSQHTASAKRATATTLRWGDQSMDHTPHFGEVAMALLPASLILATAAALLVVLI